MRIVTLFVLTILYSDVDSKSFACNDSLTFIHFAKLSSNNSDTILLCGFSNCIFFTCSLTSSSGKNIVLLKHVEKDSLYIDSYKELDRTYGVKFDSTVFNEYLILQSNSIKPLNSQHGVYFILVYINGKIIHSSSFYNLSDLDKLSSHTNNYIRDIFKINTELIRKKIKFEIK